LSTARAGTILVGEDELKRAIDALEAEKEPKLLDLQADSQTPPDSPPQQR
jgi:hypothetical protein